LCTAEQSCYERSSKYEAKGGEGRKIKKEIKKVNSRRRRWVRGENKERDKAL
jgi:hypothetical protein